MLRHLLEDHEGHEMAWPARDGAYVGATGLARGRSHAIRPWPDQEAYEGKGVAANETLAKYFRQIVELKSWKFQESSSRDGDIITSRLFPRVPRGRLAPPALRLALRYIFMRSHSLVSKALVAHVTAPLS